MKCKNTNCSNEFDDALAVFGKRYCSRACYQNKKYYTRKERHNKVCSCGAVFSTYLNKKQKCNTCTQRDRDAKRHANTKPVKHCIICNTIIPYHRSAYCSDKCSKIGNERKPKMINCKVCNSPFRRLSSELHCSKECKIITDRARGKRRRQAIIATRTERINAIRVFDKYSWHCAMCNKPTPKELIGTFHNDSPTIDHVIPLSAGGTHTYDNLQLLCQYCNCSIKRNNTQSIKRLLPCINITPYRVRVA